MSNCNCPDNGILDEIPSQNCPFDLKQIQRVIFANQGKVIWDSATGGGAGNGVPQLDSQIDTKADWEVLKTAVDETKVVFSPLIGGDPVIEAGEAITTGGGDNSTFNGITETTGVNPSSFSTMFKSLLPEVEKAMKKLNCKSLEAYFIVQGGDIVAQKIEGTENIIGFPILSFFFSDRNNAGYGTKDTHTMSFEMESGWSENLVKVKPADFNPLYDL